MGCASCSTKSGGVIAGCQSRTGCATGGCNRQNVFDWFYNLPLSFNEQYNIVEVSFKKGARKGFYRNTHHLDLSKGDLVVVEAAQGYDVGEVSLQGELVKAQMKKRKVSEREDTIRNIIRKANEDDINLLIDCRNKEQDTMIKARAIARTLKLEMKIGDVEYQGDGKKVTIYYTADDRVDFRELVKIYAREFKVKIEMRQIGARQESARIGGIGSCGRELCCATWLSDFKSVTTNAVRYQNLAINTEKLSGQCGRLKCCLNYELDTYNDALKRFPKNSEKIITEEGTAVLKKTEILKQLLWYEYEDKPGVYYKLTVDDAKELLWMNKNNQKPQNLENFSIIEETQEDGKHDDLVGQVTLSVLEEKERKKKKSKSKQKHSKNPKLSNDSLSGKQSETQDKKNKSDKNA
ncbi:MAG: regulatory iron-sulfur-containing complex subunit RicT [Chitinophagales bacterium]|nr:regulatory iron-sulfur-containing complex subunit RicT [Chitinophagales bacterium]